MEHSNAAENIQVGGVTKAVATGAATAITLNKDGRFETVIANFGGATNLFVCMVVME